MVSPKSNHPPNLHELATTMNLSIVSGEGDRTLADLTDDSRTVQPGMLFISRGGEADAFTAYGRSALQQGASAWLFHASQLGEARAIREQIQSDTTLLTTNQPIDQALCGRLAEAVFDHPSRKLRLAAVTGTNGKTTTAFIMRHLLEAAGMRCGLIGTIITDDGSPQGPRVATLTTPGAIEFSRLLAAMVRHGCQAAVAEVSSHALDQGRVAALRFDVAVFTNLTRDHLDYHGTMENYAAAKARLFESLDEHGWAVINADDAHAQRMVINTSGRIIETRIIDSSDSHCEDSPKPTTPKRSLAVADVLELSATGSRVRFNGPWGSTDVTLPYIGLHNVNNALQATTAANALTDMSKRLRVILKNSPQVPGRLERILTDHPANRPNVVVDYAHTSDALENVLRALRPITPSDGRLIVVFGCGGDRDTGKRPLMAKIAHDLADAVVITSDNPRTENPQAILDDIAAGLPQETPRTTSCEVLIEIDRETAIRRAIENARPQDTVLIAGKGHEDYQIIGHQKQHFDDREVARACLA